MGRRRIARSRHIRARSLGNAAFPVHRAGVSPSPRWPSAHRYAATAATSDGESCAPPIGGITLLYSFGFATPTVIVRVIAAKLPSPHSQWPLVRSGPSGVPLAFEPWHPSQVAPPAWPWKTRSPSATCAGVAPGGVGRAPPRDRRPDGRLPAAPQDDSPDASAHVVSDVERAVGSEREPGGTVRGLTWVLDRPGEDHVVPGGPAVGKWLEHDVVAALGRRCSIPRPVEGDERAATVGRRKP